jgi:hypothetical protein
MKKYEILYDWPIAHITLLSGSDEAEAFANALDENNQNEFVALTERIRGFGDDLVNAKANKELFKEWDDLNSCVEDFERQFGGFPGLKAKKFRLSLLLAAKLVQAAMPAAAGTPDLDETDIDDEMFELRDLVEPLPVSWFVRQNARTFSDSIVVFSPVDLLTLKDEIAGSNISPDLLFHLLAALHTSADLPPTHAVLVKKENPAIESPAVDAFARLVILSSGKAVHSPRSYASTPAVIDRDSFQAGTPYHQLNDVFYVLSEYNSRQEILTKYLTLYHVIENFMFKMPIVELERQQGGRMFSIRDFRRLYSQIDKGEALALKRLFVAIFKLQATPALTFEQQVIRRWNSLVPATSAADIEKALTALDLKKDRSALTFAEFAASEVATRFAQMVYSVRNAVVHNKETEFHLTYATLDDTICTLIESFVIPSLEEMCFALVGSPNQCVWYSNKELLLYQ